MVIGEADNTGIHISVPVVDMAEAIDFYTLLPEIRIVERSDELSQLYRGVNRISLKKVDPDSTSLQVDARSRVRARHIGFSVASAAEVDRIESILRIRGYRVISSVTERPDARTMFCCDPSGNQVEIYFDHLV